MNIKSKFKYITSLFLVLCTMTACGRASNVNSVQLPEGKEAAHIELRQLSNIETRQLLNDDIAIFTDSVSCFDLPGCAKIYFEMLDEETDAYYFSIENQAKSTFGGICISGEIYTSNDNESIVHDVVSIIPSSGFGDYVRIPAGETLYFKVSFKNLMNKGTESCQLIMMYEPRDAVSADEDILLLEPGPIHIATIDILNPNLPKSYIYGFDEVSFDGSREEQMRKEYNKQSMDKLYGDK